MTACQRGLGSGLVLLKDLPLFPVSQAAPSVSTGGVWKHRSTDHREDGEWVGVLSQVFQVWVGRGMALRGSCLLPSLEASAEPSPDSWTLRGRCPEVVLGQTS